MEYFVGLLLLIWAAAFAFCIRIFNAIASSRDDYDDDDSTTERFRY